MTHHKYYNQSGFFIYMLGVENGLFMWAIFFLQFIKGFILLGYNTGVILVCSCYLQWGIALPQMGEREEEVAPGRRSGTGRSS